jgi:hypothetical protein
MGMEARAYIEWETPVARGGDSPPSLHTPPARDLFANSKKNYIKVLSPWGGRREAIFKIFQNGHIFLKFLFFLNIKKKKARPEELQPSGPACLKSPRT